MDSPDVHSVPDRQRYRLDLEYDGTDFFGWQWQQDCRTVQGELEAALRRLYGFGLRVYGAGRTDTGVHALGQTAHFDAPPKFAPELLFRALNGILPEDVRVRRVRPVPADFHARYRARWRWYRYRIFRTPRALERRLGWHSRFGPNPDLLCQTARLLEGRHDFTAFASEGDDPGDDRRGHVCEVYAVHWEVTPEEFRFHIVADRFLRHLVRGLVGSQVDVARGRYPVDWFRTQLDAGRKEAEIFNAPPQGLCLMRVGYGPFPCLEAEGEERPELPFGLNPPGSAPE